MQVRCTIRVPYCNEHTASLFLSHLTLVFFPISLSESELELTGEVAHFEDKFRNEVQSLGQSTNLISQPTHPNTQKSFCVHSTRLQTTQASHSALFHIHTQYPLVFRTGKYTILSSPSDPAFCKTKGNALTMPADWLFHAQRALSSHLHRIKPITTEVEFLTQNMPLYS